MNPRMTVATVALMTASAGLLSACTDSGDTSTSPTPSTSTSASPTPSVDSSSDGSIAIRGDWEAPEAQWIVHFEEDGTFTEDYQGLSDFRVGKYEVEGDTVRLIGDDGNTNEGKVTGTGDDTALEFKLGTLKKQ